MTLSAPICDTCQRPFSRSNIAHDSPTCEECLIRGLEDFPILTPRVRRRPGGEEQSRCATCDEHIREVAQQADLIAFWAYQAKWYYAQSHLGNYDELSPAVQKQIDEVFEKNRINENRERIGSVEPAHDIGS